MSLITIFMTWLRVWQVLPRAEDHKERKRVFLSLRLKGRKHFYAEEEKIEEKYNNVFMGGCIRVDSLN